MDFLTAIALLAFAWAATLSGVLVGGHLVFRASGNAGSLFQRTRGGAYNLADDAEEVAEDEMDIPPDLQQHVGRFQKSFDPGQEIFGGGTGARHGAARPFDAPVPPKEEDNERD